MKKIPQQRCPIYKGTMKPINTTLANLMLQPKGSTCLYQKLDSTNFKSHVAEIEKKCGGWVCVEPLIALDLDQSETFELFRVTVVKPCKVQTQISKSDYFFSASPHTLSKCLTGSVALYEQHTKTNIGGSIRKQGANYSLRKYHIIDIRRGITKPILAVTITQQGRPTKNKTKSQEIYAAYINEES